MELEHVSKATVSIVRNTEGSQVVSLDFELSPFPGVISVELSRLLAERLLYDLHSTVNTLKGIQKAPTGLRAKAAHYLTHGFQSS